MRFSRRTLLEHFSGYQHFSGFSNFSPNVSPRRCGSIASTYQILFRSSRRYFRSDLAKRPHAKAGSGVGGRRALHNERKFSDTKHISVLAWKLRPISLACSRLSRHFERRNEKGEGDFGKSPTVLQVVALTKWRVGSAIKERHFARLFF